MIFDLPTVPNKRKKGIYRNCPRCNKNFYTYPYLMKTNKVYCSIKCKTNNPPKNCIICNSFFTKKPEYPIEYWENKKCCSQICYFKSKKGKDLHTLGIYQQKGKPPPKTAFKKGHKSWNIGRKWSEEVSTKLKKSHQGKRLWRQNIPLLTIRGNRHWNWRGGITDNNNKIRTSLEYKIWRRKVFERDNYECVTGGKEHGNKLQADHIKPFFLFPELRLDVNNGRTLCIDCHKATDTYTNRSLKREMFL